MQKSSFGPEQAKSKPLALPSTKIEVEESKTLDNYFAMPSQSPQQMFKPPRA